MTPSKLVPDRKVLAGGIGGLVTWWIMTALEYFAGISISSEVASLIMTAVVPSVSFIVPPSVADIARRLDSDLRQTFEERQAETPGLSEPREIPPVVSML
jgi:hypothetical protein